MRLLFVVLIAAVASCARPRPPGYAVVDAATGLPVVSERANAPLPFDPRVRKGTLRNGLTWYVEPNARPADRVDIRLVLKVGSVLETDDERGVAHYLEHLAFNGTEHFPGTTLFTWLQSLGMRVGADVNAFTGHDTTTFLLQVPTDVDGTVDTALAVVRDWMDGIVFDDEECVRERGVVLEEWRGSQGLEDRLRAATLPLMFYGSLYADRSPIGTEASIQSLDCDTARAFHARWYRPELAAVVVVGDVDPEAIEAKIEAILGDLPRTPRGAPPRPEVPIPVVHPPQILRFQDAELGGRAVVVAHKAIVPESPSHAAYRTFLVDQLAQIVLAERLGLASTDPAAPFLAAQAGASGLAHPLVAMTLTAVPRPGEHGRALEALLRARRALVVHGVLPSELTRARRAMQTAMDGYYAERDATDTPTHADELVRNFLEDEPVPGIPYEYAMSLALLPAIDVAEVNAHIRSRSFLPADGRVVQLLAPADDTLPDDAAILAILARTDAETPPVPIDPEADTPLVPDPPAPGEVKIVGTDPALGTTTLRLSNGIQVLVKPTTLQTDEVVVRAVATGGLSLVDDADRYAGLAASSVVRQSGVGTLPVADLARRMGGRGVDVDVALGLWAETAGGISTVGELPTLFEWLYAALTAPRFDPAVFDRDMAARRDAIGRQESSPEGRFEAAWNRMLWQDHPLYVPWTDAELDTITLDAIERAWRARFADLSDLTLVVVGSVDVETLAPQLAQWVASLPGRGLVEEPADLGAARIPGPVTRRLEEPGLPSARVRVLFHAPWEPGSVEGLRLDAASALVEATLHESLREELGGTYGVGVDHTLEHNPTREATLQIDFTCDPARLDELLARMEAGLAEVVTQPVPPPMIASFREKNKRMRAAQVQNNGWWAASIASSIALGRDPATLLTFEADQDEVTADSIRDTLARLLRPEHRVTLIQTRAD